jgi:hypothetical protein
LVSLFFREEHKAEVVRKYGAKEHIWVQGRGHGGVENTSRFVFHTKYKNEMGWGCSMYRDRASAYRVLVERPNGKRPLGRPTSRR